MEENIQEKEIGNQLKAIAQNLEAVSRAQPPEEVTWGPLFGTSGFYTQYIPANKTFIMVRSSAESTMDVFVQITYRKEGADYRVEAGTLPLGEARRFKATPQSYYYI